MLTENTDLGIVWPELDELVVGFERYMFYRPYLQDGDILEWSGPALVSRLIRWVTKKDVNHTGSNWRVQEYEELPGDRILTLEALSHGFTPSYLSHSICGYGGKVYVLPLKIEHSDKRKAFVRHQISLVGIEYDFKGLFSNAFGRVNTNARRFFCSESVGYSLEATGIIPKQEKALRPGEFEALGVTLPRIRIY